jgi:hypothetical protein
MFLFVSYPFSFSEFPFSYSFSALLDFPKFHKKKFLESKENHEKHRREKNHFNEAAFDPKYKKGPHEWREKGNKLH